MPNFNFIDTKTGESWTESMTNAERESFLEANPHIQQTLSPANISYSAGGIKTDGEWREVLGRIKRGNRGSKIETGNLTTL